MRSALRPVLKWTGIVGGAVIVVAVLVLALFDWNRLRGPITRLASARSGHPVQIAGNLDVHPFSWTPSVSVSGLTVGNPAWVAQMQKLENKPEHLATVEHLSFKIALLPLFRGDIVLSELIAEKPQVFVYRAADGRANWKTTQRSAAEQPSTPPNLPAIRKLVIKDGKLDLVDEIRKLDLSGTITANESNAQDRRPFHIRGIGKLNRAPFDLQMDGNSLLHVERRKPYPFEVRMTAGSTQLEVQGSVTKPFDLRRYQANANLSGDDLADLYLLTGLALPNTPPYRISGHLERDGDTVKFRRMQGKVGDSDIHGNVTIDTSKARPHLDAKLASKTLDIDDLAAPLGAAPSVKKGETVSQKERAVARAMQANQKLFPDATLQVNRIRGMDATLQFRADSFKTKTIPLKKFSIDAKLENGVLVLDPVAFELPQGRIDGKVRLDARTDDPVTEYEMHVVGMELSQFKPEKSNVAPFEGVLLARMKGKGHGNSVATVLATSSGTASAVLPKGEIREAFAELTGVNVSRGLGLLLMNDQEHVGIRCGVADFRIQDGTMRAQNLVFDTKNVLITGTGDVHLDGETLDLKIKGQPKKLRLLRLRSPIAMRGSIRKPSVRIEGGKAVAQYGVAAVLGAVVAPLAAVIAFVDPGLAKDANCGALLAEARGDGQTKNAQAASSDARMRSVTGTRSKTLR